MPGKLTITDAAPVRLDGDPTRAQLDFRNETEANGGARVYYAWQKEFTAGEAAYMEPGEGKSLIGAPGYVGKPLWFRTATGASTVVLYS